MITNTQELFAKLESEYMQGKEFDFRVGDTIKVHFRIKEKNRERIQLFEGIVIRKRGSGLGKTFTVRKISFNIGVERIFPLYSPKIEKIEVVRRGKVRRAKLYYLRERTGKAVQIKRLMDKKNKESKKDKTKDKAKD